MAGLARAQQLFNRAILAPIAALLALTGGDRQAAKQLQKTGGHPLLAKYTKSSNPNANRRGYEYPGYCAGERETQRRWHRLQGGQA